MLPLLSGSSPRQVGVRITGDKLVSELPHLNLRYFRTFLQDHICGQTLHLFGG